MKFPLLWFVILIDVDNLRSDLRMNVYAILSLLMPFHVMGLCLC